MQEISHIQMKTNKLRKIEYIVVKDKTNNLT